MHCRAGERPDRRLTVTDTYNCMQVMACLRLSGPCPACLPVTDGRIASSSCRRPLEHLWSPDGLDEEDIVITSEPDGNQVYLRVVRPVGNEALPCVYCTLPACCHDLRGTAAANDTFQRHCHQDGSLCRCCHSLWCSTRRDSRRWDGQRFGLRCPHDPSRSDARPPRGVRRGGGLPEL